MTSILGTLKKVLNQCIWRLSVTHLSDLLFDLSVNVDVYFQWLKTQDISPLLDVPAEDVTEGLQYGILFIDHLRSSRRFPARLTHGEIILLQTFKELALKVKKY